MRTAPTFALLGCTLYCFAFFVFPNSLLCSCTCFIYCAAYACHQTHSWTVTGVHPFLINFFPALFFAVYFFLPYLDVKLLLIAPSLFSLIISCL